MGAKRSESIVTWLIIGAQQIHAPHPTKGVHRNKFRRGQICANRQILGGVGNIWTVNSKHLASWKLTHTVQLPCKYYSYFLISLSIKTSKSVSDLKSIGGGQLPLPHLSTPFPPPSPVLWDGEIQLMFLFYLKSYI